VCEYDFVKHKCEDTQCVKPFFDEQDFPSVIGHCGRTDEVVRTVDTKNSDAYIRYLGCGVNRVRHPQHEVPPVGGFGETFRKGPRRMCFPGEDGANQAFYNAMCEQPDQDDPSKDKSCKVFGPFAAIYSGKMTTQFGLEEVHLNWAQQEYWKEQLSNDPKSKQKRSPEKLWETSAADQAEKTYEQQIVKDLVQVQKDRNKGKAKAGAQKASTQKNQAAVQASTQETKAAPAKNKKKPRKRKKSSAFFQLPANANAQVDYEFDHISNASSAALLEEADHRFQKCNAGYNPFEPFPDSGGGQYVEDPSVKMACREPKYMGFRSMITEGTNEYIYGKEDPALAWDGREAYHLIFVIDRSESMESEWASLKEVFQEFFRKFNNEKATDHIVSVILFNDQAKAPPGSVRKRLGSTDFQQSFWNEARTGETKFKPAADQLKKIIDQGDPQTPIIVFLTGFAGGSWDDADVGAAATKIKEASKNRLDAKWYFICLGCGEFHKLSTALSFPEGVKSLSGGTSLVTATLENIAEWRSDDRVWPHQRVFDPPFGHSLQEVSTGTSLWLMTYGFSGAGKTTTLLGTASGIAGEVEMFMQEHEYNLWQKTMTVFEVYGRMDMDNGKLKPDVGNGLWIYLDYLGDSAPKVNFVEAKELMDQGSGINFEKFRDEVRKGRKILPTSEAMKKGMDKIENFRRDKMKGYENAEEGLNHIRATPNNPDSSRGTLIVVLDVAFRNRKSTPDDPAELQDGMLGRLLHKDDCGKHQTEAACSTSSQCIWLEKESEQSKSQQCVEGTWGQIVVVDMAGMEDPKKMLKSFLRMHDVSPNKTDAYTDPQHELRETTLKEIHLCQEGADAKQREEYLGLNMKDFTNEDALRGKLSECVEFKQRWKFKKAASGASSALQTSGEEAKAQVAAPPAKKKKNKKKQNNKQGNKAEQRRLLEVIRQNTTWSSSLGRQSRQIRRRTWNLSTKNSSAGRTSRKIYRAK